MSSQKESESSETEQSGSCEEDSCSEDDEDSDDYSLADSYDAEVAHVHDYENELEKEREIANQQLQL